VNLDAVCERLVTLKMGHSEVDVEPKICSAIMSYQAVVLEVNVDRGKCISDL
jgi:hypothetical protein